jgi:hypothetical protein
MDVVLVRNPTRAWIRTFRSFDEHFDIDVIAIVDTEDLRVATKTWVWSRGDMFDACSKMPERYPEYSRVLCVDGEDHAFPVDGLFDVMKPGVINAVDDDLRVWGVISDRYGAEACRNRGVVQKTLAPYFEPRNPSSSNPRAILYVNHHDDESEAIARRNFSEWPFVVHVRIPTTPILENVQYCSDFLISRKSEWKNAAFVGTMAYSAMIKIMFEGSIDFSRVPESVDVIAMYPGAPRTMIEQGEWSHPGFGRVWTLVMDALDIPETSRSPNPFYSNYFMMAPRHFELFCVFMKNAWRIFQENEAVHDALYRQDAKYRGRQTDASLVNLYGVPWYPFATFVMERLCPVFCSLLGLRVFYYFDSGDVSPPISRSCSGNT